MYISLLANLALVGESRCTWGDSTAFVQRDPDHSMLVPEFTQPRRIAGYPHY